MLPNTATSVGGAAIARPASKSRPEERRLPGINSGAIGIITHWKEPCAMRHPLRRTRIALVLGLALLVIGPGEAREPQSGTAAAAVDVERVGPQVGSSLPDFTLRDQRGEPHALKSLL